MQLIVNERVLSFDGDENLPLLFVLRNDLGLTGAKLGCGTGHCGACTVIVNGNAVQSCTVPMWSLAAASVLTIEGLERADGELDPFQEALLAEQAAQCGFCIAGIVMTTRAMLGRDPSAGVDQIRRELAERNLCRCGAHHRILRAVARVVASRSKARPGAEEV